MRGGAVFPLDPLISNDPIMIRFEKCLNSAFMLVRQYLCFYNNRIILGEDMATENAFNPPPSPQLLRLLYVPGRLFYCCPFIVVCTSDCLWGSVFGLCYNRFLRKRVNGFRTKSVRRPSVRP